MEENKGKHERVLRLQKQIRDSILIRREEGSRRLQAILNLDSKEVSMLHGNNVF